MPSNSCSFLIAPDFRYPEYVQITPRTAGWDYLNFAARQMSLGEMWHFETHENELALVVLGGTCEITSNIGKWTDVGRRLDVFSGMPYTLYLPPETRFTVEAKSEHLDVAYGWCVAKEAHPARLVKPA